MATMLAVPLKNSAELDLVRPLKNFIKNTFGDEGSDDYSSQLDELHRLRNNAVCRKLDKHNTSLETLARYYDQLKAIENKLPISESHASVTFTWQDAFDKGSFFGGGRKQSGSTGSYEMVCVLFNIAAMNSQIAALQSSEDDDSLKTAAKQFQQAAGIFNHLKDTVVSSVQSIRTFDIHPDCLAALGALMLAQAQDTFFKKARQDKMKNGVIAKIAMTASEEYAEALKLCQVSYIKEILPKEWIPIVAGKQAFMHATAEYYQSMVSQNAKNYGEEIGRLNHAIELLQSATHRGGQHINFKSTTEKVQRALAAAKKDNDFIYHDIVPEIANLKSIGSAAIAKPLEIPSPLYPKFSDLFEKLVPLAVHNALDAFESRKNDIISGEISKLRESTQLMDSVLASLNLPASIEDMGGSTVPPSVLQKSTAVREKGGIASIDKLFNDMPDLLKRNTEILNESLRLLDEESKSDDEMRERFKERWTRLQSGQLTTPLRTESSKYRTILNNAIQADGVVREKYNVNREFIVILSKDQKDLGAALPAASAAAALKDNPAVQSLRSLMKQVESIKAEREVTEAELKNTKCDMTSKFLGALASDGAIDEESISVEDLDRMFSPLIQQVQESIHRQEVLLNNVQDANTRFCTAKQSNTSASNREEVLCKLAAAHNAYMELTANLTEGTKFYNDLTQVLVRFQGKVSDLCFARRTEKEELLRDLTQSIANQPSSPPPVTPAHHTQVFDQGQNVEAEYNTPTGCEAGDRRGLTTAQQVDLTRPDSNPHAASACQKHQSLNPVAFLRNSCETTTTTPKPTPDPPSSPSFTTSSSTSPCCTTSSSTSPSCTSPSPPSPSI
ncbi:programmed cell death 6-interacting protein-like isoform X4 [Asterias amurensis]|uniref:programmed cell death 6-interacting protein-like isoform X4 n=1 Tax=Asterias amurensis TaxID=7602 RepID=UPI003AB874F0